MKHTLTHISFAEYPTNMVSIDSLPSLSSLKFTHDSDDDRYWIPVSDWTEYLKGRLTPGDKWREVKSSNITRIFEKDQSDFMLKGEKCWTTLSALIGFAYHHKHILESCHTIVKEVEFKILGNTNTVTKRTEKEHGLPIQNVLELYNLIAKSNVGDKRIQDILLPDIQIEDRQIETLVTVHKDNFSKEEWAKICLFEWHFSKVNSVVGMTYEKQLRERYRFYQQCQEVDTLAATIQRQSRDIASRNINRREYGESLHNVQIYGRTAHNPSKIDCELTETVKETLHTTSLVSIGCNATCQHQPGIHVFIEVPGTITNLPDRTELAVHQIRNYLVKHEDVCHEMILFKEGSFADFRTKDEQHICRFDLFDAIYSKRLDNQILKRIQFENESEEDNNATCELCFPLTEDPPLHWKNLNLIQEWLLYVPLLLQTILGVFINKVSLKRSGNKHGFLISKIVCLYSMFERLLNLQNRQYFGVVQELNTDELVFNYHSVGTVFSITSTMGITQSLKSAERRLKLYSNEDLCYFSTYLKRYPIKYESVSGLKEDHVSLQNCYLAFCVDNLVRLSFKQDKERNETKSTQIATLPMTLKGIPKDTMISQHWHDDEICDGSDHCLCKSERILTKEHLKKTLLEPDEDEKRVLENFKTFMTWSWTTTWVHTSGYQKLKTLFQEAADSTTDTDAIYIPLPEKNYDGTYHDDTIDLNMSLMSLSVPEDEELDILDASMKSLQLSDSGGSEQSSLYSSDDDDSVSASSASSEISSISSESDARISCSESELDISMLQNRSFEEETGNAANENNKISNAVKQTTTHTVDQSEIARESDSQEYSERDERSIDPTNEDESENLWTFGFSIFQPPPMICRHPPPAIGRDDSITKLREVLDEVLIKTGNYYNSSPLDSRILFAPDQKIGNNLLKLREQDARYRVFLPEFPLLHLRKSKITNLCTGYKDAGIIQLLMYMNDDDKEKDWMKLVEATHIEHATRNIKRLSLTIHLFMMVLFIRSLSAATASKFLHILDSGELDDKWTTMFDEFLDRNKKKNATFSLHCDIMKHCDEVLAIAAAEKLGGPDGYQLLLSAVKQSLPFAFLNGATSYGAFCVRLLISHYSTGRFYQGMKHCMFSTRHKESETNIALDQQREMDHRDALKGFRPRATADSVLPRMTQVDRMAEIRTTRLSIWGKSDTDDVNDTEENNREQGLTWKVTEKDVSHVIPTLQMMLRANDAITKEDSTPKNVYGVSVRALSDAILDEKTFEVGKYLITKYVCRSALLGYSENDIPVLHNHLGPSELMQKVARGKGVVVKRATCKSLTVDNQRSAREKKRKQEVDKMKKVYDCLSSDMNTCQAVIKPDCTKGPVAKSVGIKSAILWCLQECLQYTVSPATPVRGAKKESAEAKRLKKETTSYLAENGIVIFSAKTVPQRATENIRVAIVEFAGAKFKTFAMTGRQYLEFVETSVINKIKMHWRSVTRIIICEEKYHFTPNDLKGPTRQKRSGTKEEASVYHLKKGAEIVSAETFDKRAATQTTAGKVMVGLFLAENIPTLKLNNLLIDIDSEMLMENCQCGTTATNEPCVCDAFAIPVRAEFGPHGFVKQTKMTQIRQRKGEAEMAMVDWLGDCVQDLKDGEGIVAYVTSGDIDAVVIHMFALSLHWPRKHDSSFSNPVYVVLQKPEGQHDIYCITRIIEIIEKRYGLFSGVQISVGLAMGGNDFFPKFHHKSHKKMLQIFVENYYMWSLLDIGRDDDGIPISATVNKSVFVDYIKHVYCQSINDPQKLSFEALRQSTIKMPGQSRFKPPDLWLPPQQALHQLALLLECQIDYLFTAWHPDTKVPDFAAKGCLKVNEDGYEEYDLGEEVRVEKQETLLVLDEEELKKVLKASRRKSSQQRAKRGTQATPKKRRKIRRQLITSTPR